MRKGYEKYMLYGLAIILIVALVVSVGSFFGISVATMSVNSAELRSSETSNQAKSQATIQMPTMGRMSLTNYDKELARQMMDKNNDGKCDACGMPVEMCMDSGQLQCNMDSESTIGVLSSQHIHADFKVYTNSKPVNFADPSYYMKSSFIHVDDNQNKEDAGGILHMHATGVPLWIFLKSISMKLPEGVKAYVNGKEILNYQNYVFNDLDKILITDGKGDFNQQSSTITDYAKNH